MLHDAKLRAREPTASIAQMAAQGDDKPVGIAPDVYTSNELLELEYELIFKKEWQCVGRIDELNEPGDYLTTDIGPVPVIINMRDSGEIGAMVNVCAHRLSPVASGCGSTRRFACPYHGWVYEKDGALRQAPRMPEDFDVKSYALSPLAVEIWNGFIYVNLDVNASSLSESLSPLTALFRNYHLENMRLLHKGWEVWDANWKVVTENFLESYHLEMTHANTLAPIAPQDTLRMASEGERHAFHVFDLADMAIVPVDEAIALPNPDLTEKDKKAIYAGGIFPNHLFTVAYDQFTWMRAQPITVDKTLIEWGIAGAFNIPRGTKPDPDHPNLYYIKEIPKVNAEDKAIVEGVQRGARSGMVRPARLQTNEHGLITFARFLSERFSAVK